MSLWKKTLASLALLVGLSPTLVHAQGVGVPPAPAAPAVPGVGAAPAAAAAAGGGNIWSKLCMTPEQKAACKAKLCRSALGQLLNNSLQPIGAFSGGLIGPFCPAVTAEDLAKPPTSAEGAAARAKADAAAAKERREAVRYLGTLDCRYWPEAEAALINSLRADRSECVRLEAALALNRGCCCTKNIIKALALTVSGATDDGNPSECSPRVKAVARVALERCLACYVDITPAPEQEQLPPPEKKKEQGEKPDPTEKPTTDVQQVDPKAATMPTVGDSAARRKQSETYYRRTATVSHDQVLENARAALSKVRPVAHTMSAPQQRRERSLVAVFEQALSDQPEATATPVAMKPQTPTLPKPVPQQVQTRVPPVPIASQPPQTNFATQQLGQSASNHSMQPSTAQPDSNFATQQVSQPKTTYTRSIPTPVPAKTQRTQGQPNAKAVQLVQPVSTRLAKPTVSQTQHKSSQVNPPSIAQLLQLLTASSDPRHRAWAAHMLSAFDGGSNPHIIAALVGSAHRDESPATRVACVRSLVRLNVRSNAVLTVIQGLQSDPDASVRQEALRAFQTLGGNQLTASRR